MANQKPITAERADWLIRQYGAATLRVLEIQRDHPEFCLAQCYLQADREIQDIPSLSQILDVIALIPRLPEVPA